MKPYIKKNPISISDITAIVATKEREGALNNMVTSFLSFYPNLNIIAVDSSVKPIPRSDITHIIAANDIWISSQRNIALDKVSTELFLLLDDDFVCTEKTKMFELINWVKSWIYNIFWWAVNNIWSEKYLFHWDYEIIWNTLFHFIDISKDNNKYDTIFNFFVWETDLIRQKWARDHNLKLAREHDDFFLNLKKEWLSVWYSDKVVVDHYSYKKYHGWSNSIDSVNHFLSKRDIKDKIEVRLIKWYSN